MKTQILILFITISLSSFGQKDSNYIEYYNLVNEGDKQLYFGNDSLAYEFYKKGFDKVDYIHNSNLMKVSQIASRMGDYKYCCKILRCAFEQGEKKSILEYESFKEFKNTHYHQALIDSFSQYNATFLTTFNSDYKKQIDSLYYIDQNIIRGNTEVKGDYNIEFSCDFYQLDSLLFTSVLLLIDKYGFATEKNVGEESFRKVWLFYHHNIRLPKNEQYIPLAQEALKQGAYLPENYAWMFDQSLTNKNETPYFYYGVASTDHLTDEEKMDVNEKRKNWGIKPLESLLIERIEENGRVSIMQTTLW